VKADDWVAGGAFKNDDPEEPLSAAQPRPAAFFSPFSLADYRPGFRSAPQEDGFLSKKPPRLLRGLLPESSGEYAEWEITATDEKNRGSE